MKKNITIVLEEELAKEARILAAKKDTSISQLLGEYLKTILTNEGNKSRAKKDFFRLTRKKYVLNYSKREFKRDDLYER